MPDQELSRWLLSLVLVLLFSLGTGHLFSELKLPRVVGEICAGLVLGPSFLGAVAPELYAWIFAGFPDQGRLLSVFYWLGLILLMFTAGFRITTRFEKGDRALVSMLIVGGIGLPFLFGLLAAPLFQQGEATKPWVLPLIIGSAAAVTSIPVITRIFMDLGLMGSRFAHLVLGAAAIQDVVLWIVVSAGLGMQQSEAAGDLSGLARTLIGTVAFGCFTVFAVPALLRLARLALFAASPEASLVGYTLLACLVLVTLASVLGVNVVFGALLAGIVIGRLPGNRLEQVRRNITSISAWFFVPIYFALVGLQMDLPHNFDPGLIFGFLVASSLVKVASVVLCARLANATWRRAIDFGVTMNARGGPGIVLASLARAAHIIDEKMFVALVVASILTSLAAGIWLRLRLASVMAPEGVEPQSLRP